MTERTVVVGASRGLGLALAQRFAALGDEVNAVARTPLAAHEGIRWLQCDVGDLADVQRLSDALRGRPITQLIFNVGVWEQRGFSDTSVDELASIVDTSLRAAVVLVRQLEGEIRQGGGLVVFIGSTCGLPNEGSSAVAYTASKFGIRGAAQALREVFRADGVRVTCLNIGSTATDVPLGESSTALAKYAGERIPVDDVVEMVQVLHRLSPAACVKEITMPAQFDRDV